MDIMFYSYIFMIAESGLACESAVSAAGNIIF